MATDSFFTLACAGLIGILFGLALTFAGYRLFMVLLPIWGFVFGFTLGAQTLQALFGQAFPFLGTVTGWMVGLIVGSIFGLLSYFFYVVAVAIVAGSLGYSVAVALLLAIGLRMGVIVWLIGMFAAVVLAIVTLRFNLAKPVIIIATSVLGAASAIGSVVLMFNPLATVAENPVGTVLNASPLAVILFLILAGLGIAAQMKENQHYTVVTYDRWHTAP